jgi:hypothetical protein
MLKDKFKSTTFLKTMMSSLKVEIQAAMMKMNQMKNKQKNNISKIF